MVKKTKDLGKDYPIEKRFQNLLEQIQEILEKMGIIDQVEINTDLLARAIIDYFEDVDRIKEFEDIPRVNVDKIYSYGTYWLLRRHPIQITDKNIDQRFMYINEKVFIAIMIPKMLAEMGVDLDVKSPAFNSFLKTLYYNFKYRLYSQQTLELMVEAFFCACRMAKTEEPDG